MDFFITYANDDRAWADWIAWHLSNARYSVELDTWDFRPGENYVLRLEDALEAATNVLIIQSQNYGRFTSAMTELDTALVRGRQRILSVTVDDAEPSIPLHSIVNVDLRGLGADDA